MPVRPARVLVHARSPAVRAGLRELLHRAGFEVVDDSNPDDPLATALDRVGPQTPADVVVVDLSGRPTAAAGTLDEELDAFGVPAVLLVESAAEAQFDARFDARSPQAWLFRDASADELAAAVRAVAAGLVALDPALVPATVERRAASPPDGAAGVSLTERETEVLRLIAAGLPNKAIAFELGISGHTVKFHVGTVLSKLGARSRTEAVTLAARRGLIAL